jgi:hypothetical protein
MSDTYYRPRSRNRDKYYYERRINILRRLALASVAAPLVAQREFWDTAVWCEDGADRPGMALRLDYTLDRLPALWEMRSTHHRGARRTGAERDHYSPGRMCRRGLHTWKECECGCGGMLVCEHCGVPAPVPGDGVTTTDDHVATPDDHD